nr:MAG TPA: hypothetical protein [Caudoviricetes sp.]
MGVHARALRVQVPMWPGAHVLYSRERNKKFFKKLFTKYF